MRINCKKIKILKEKRKELKIIEKEAEIMKKVVDRTISLKLITKIMENRDNNII